MSKQYKTLFFDLDHTLWDFETNSTFTLNALYEEFQLHKLGILEFGNFSEIYREINEKLWARFRKGFLSREDLRWKRMWQTLVHFKVNNEKLAKEMSDRYLEILPTQNQLFPHALDVLEYCSNKNYDLHLITNGFEATQYQKLRNSNINHYFGKMITSEQAMSMKPHKEIFEFAIKETGAQLKESMMIGDALDVDILGAMNFGMDQIFFNPTKIMHNDKPTHEIYCLSEMMEII